MTQDTPPQQHRPLIAPWLARPLLASRGAYGQVALAAAFINLFALATSLFSMTVYDRVVPNNATNSLVVLSTGVLIILAFDFVLKSLRIYFLDLAGQRVDRDVGGAIFQQMLGMKLAHRKGSIGGFAGSLREFETLRDFFASATLAAIVDVPFLIVFMAVIAAIGGTLVAMPLVMVPVVIVTSLAVQPALARLTVQAVHDGYSKQGVLVESVGGLETIKCTDAGSMMRRRWESAVDNHAANSTRQRAVAGIAINVAGLAQNLSYIGTVIFGVAMIADHNLTTGGLVACSILSGRAVAPLGQIANLLTRVSHARAAYRELDKLMAVGGEVEAGREYLRRDAFAGGVALVKVGFRYPGLQARVLADVSFALRPGERVGILGRTGSGKSTIARLILGLYEPGEGAVLIDGSDVRQLHPEDLRRHLGAVLQDVALFSGSVKDNIALGRAGVSDEEVLRVARIAGVQDFMGSVPGGYDLRLRDRGEGLSGGQRQAIAIARALAGRPAILLFDEPTSAMDTQSENLLIDRLAGEIAERTVVVVTHRASMLRLVERVIVLEHGKIVADGPRDAVLNGMSEREAPTSPAASRGFVDVAGAVA